MRHLKSYNLFENNATDVAPPKEVVDFITKEVGWNRGIEDAVKIACAKAREMADKGMAKSGLVKSSGENQITKSVYKFYFGNNIPKIVNEQSWDVLQKKWDHYWRGVSRVEYVDDLKYSGSFVGGQNLYDGVWITSKKEYAEGYSDKSNPDTLIELLLNPNCNIANGHEVEDKSRSMMMKIVDMVNQNIENDFDTYLHFSLHYIKELLLVNSTALAIFMGYDAVEMDRETDKTGRVLIVFNREKLAIKE